MRSSISPKIGLVALVLLACTSTTEAHSWVEEIYRIASNGTFTGLPGYPRGFTARAAGVDPDLPMVYLLPPNGRAPPGILSTDLMCKDSQAIGKYTPGSNMLNAAAGDFIAMTYNENGHVTLPTSTTRPAGNGTVFVYGTQTPANSDTFLGIHKVWNPDGTGGDKRGKLLATRYFDDGQCYQAATDNDPNPTNQRPLRDARRALHPESTQIPCQTDVQIPADAGSSGNYTFYWVWDFAHLDPSTGAVATNETYTTCLDVGLTANPIPKVGDFVAKQLVTSEAIKEQLGKAMLVDPTAALALSGASPAASPQASGSPSSPVASASAPAASVLPAQIPGYSAIPPQQSSIASNPQSPLTVTVTVTVHDGGSGSSASAPVASSQPTTLATSAVPQAGQNPAPMSSASAPAPSNSSSVVFVAPSVLSPAPFNTGSQAATSAVVATPAAAAAALQRRRAL
ncbi:hypothetical protein LHYA1_G007107 [Lachnellula hyalina]|uniref:DUF7492 domain-containing protein n=1 Tax=Lachnellula hyalina TaxID=1316788 RepID=A0A8H8QXV4_9HELO|nr:uncharacterized protein LHYA1_G007107 [Lachnellula hyalina]TVY24051.1 hypothetical protein LHYA1_G007107 [Lachnellula hyalina]